MTTRTWLLLNAVLLVTATLAIKQVLWTPSVVKQQKKRTKEAIEAVQESREKLARPQKPSLRKTVSARDSEDTWPRIRRGDFASMWQQTLFSKNRTETIENEAEDSQGTEEDETLPAPPNFELIGILNANSAKVAIIEIKSSTSRANMQRGRGGRRMPQPPQPNTPANPTANFQPSFLTLHEGDDMRDTGFKVTSIRPESHAVILVKEGLEFKLALDRNSASATQRKDSQNTYAKSVQERLKAAEKASQPQTLELKDDGNATQGNRQQQGRPATLNSNAPVNRGNQVRPGMPQQRGQTDRGVTEMNTGRTRMRGNFPRPADNNAPNMRRTFPARQE